MQHVDIKGWGADVALVDRPGVPQETHPPTPVGNGTLGIPAAQSVGTPSAAGPLRAITPVYGTAQPPRGLSGVIRKAAYRMPDYKPRRWMMLMLADRIDVIEHNPARLAMVASGIVLGLFGLGALVARRR